MELDIDKDNHKTSILNDSTKDTCPNTSNGSIEEVKTKESTLQSTSTPENENNSLKSNDDHLNDKKSEEKVENVDVNKTSPLVSDELTKAQTSEPNIDNETL